jgi:DNA invertase Pin-like site-specific DNA recombinase
MPNRAALYHRVSTVDQDLNAAHHELRAAARRIGTRVVLEQRETGTGANNDRPGLARVLRAAQRGEIDVVLVWKLDRFGRSALDLLGNIRLLEAAGVRFVAVTQGIDIRPGGDSMSRLLLTMLGGVAEFERDLIIERTRLGLANARRAGKRIGRPPVALPERDRVLRLRAGGATWLEVAEHVGCTVWAARVAVKTGGSKSQGSARRGRPAENAL